MASSNPIRLGRELGFYQLDDHRHPNCKRYEKCLNKACRENWQSFSCSMCVFFRKYKKKEKMRKEIEWGKGNIGKLGQERMAI